MTTLILLSLAITWVPYLLWELGRDVVIGLKKLAKQSRHDVLPG